MRPVNQRSVGFATSTRTQVDRKLSHPPVADIVVPPMMQTGPVGLRMADTFIRGA